MEHASAERSAPRPAFSDVRRLMAPATAAAIRDALDRYAENGVLDSRLRPAARMVCSDAKASEMRVEQMLIALKNEWAALLEQRRIPHGAARTDLTSRFITLCIHAFYEAQSRSLDSVDGARLRV